MLVLPADLTERLPQVRRGHVAPAGFVEVLPVHEVVEGAQLTTGLALEGPAPKEPPIGLELGARVVVAALGLDRQRAARVLRPNTGFEPEISATVEIADSGIRSQFTVSPKDSLTRTRRRRPTGPRGCPAGAKP